MSVRFDQGGSVGSTTYFPNYNLPYTLMFWWQPNMSLPPAATFYLFAIRRDSSQIERIHWVASEGAPKFQINTNAIGFSGLGTTDVWQHVAVVRESTTSCKVYVDGVLAVTNTTDVGSRGAATNWSIGFAFAGGTDVNNSRFADCKVWSTALTVGEIGAEMPVQAPVKTSDLWGYYPLTVHTDLNDYSGNGRHLTGYGTLTTEDDPPLVKSSGGGTLTPTVWANKWALEALTI